MQSSSGRMTSLSTTRGSTTECTVRRTRSQRRRSNAWSAAQSLSELGLAVTARKSFALTALISARGNACSAKKKTHSRSKRFGKSMVPILKHYSIRKTSKLHGKKRSKQKRRRKRSPWPPIIRKRKSKILKRKMRLKTSFLKSPTTARS